MTSNYKMSDTMLNSLLAVIGVLTGAQALNFIKTIWENRRTDHKINQQEIERKAESDIKTFAARYDALLEKQNQDYEKVSRELSELTRKHYKLEGQYELMLRQKTEEDKAHAEEKKELLKEIADLKHLLEIEKKKTQKIGEKTDATAEKVETVASKVL